MVMCQFDTAKISKTEGGRELLKHLDKIISSHKSPPVMDFEPVRSAIKRRDNFKKILGVGAETTSFEDQEVKCEPSENNADVVKRCHGCVLELFECKCPEEEQHPRDEEEGLSQDGLRDDPQ